MIEALVMYVITYVMSAFYMYYGAIRICLGDIGPAQRVERLKAASDSITEERMRKYAIG